MSPPAPDAVQAASVPATGQGDAGKPTFVTRMATAALTAPMAAAIGAVNIAGAAVVQTTAAAAAFGASILRARRPKRRDAEAKAKADAGGDGKPD